MTIEPVCDFGLLNTFSLDNVYFMDGGGDIAFFRNDVGHIAYVTETPLAEAAQRHGLNSFQLPDGRGFAINFKKVSGIFESYYATDEATGAEGWKAFRDGWSVPEINNDRIWVFPRGFPARCDGAAILFNDSASVLGLPIAVEDVGRLRLVSITDARLPARPAHAPHLVLPRQRPRLQ